MALIVPSWIGISYVFPVRLSVIVSGVLAHGGLRAANGSRGEALQSWCSWSPPLLGKGHPARLAFSSEPIQ